MNKHVASASSSKIILFNRHDIPCRCISHIILQRESIISFILLLNISSSYIPYQQKSLQPPNYYSNQKHDSYSRFLLLLSLSTHKINQKSPVDSSPSVSPECVHFSAPTYSFYFHLLAILPQFLKLSPNPNYYFFRLSSGLIIIKTNKIISYYKTNT